MESCSKIATAIRWCLFVLFLIAVYFGGVELGKREALTKVMEFLRSVVAQPAPVDESVDDPFADSSDPFADPVTRDPFAGVSFVSEIP